MNNTKGYMIAFETKTDPPGFYAAEYFPDKSKGQPLIETEEKAWFLAKQMASRAIGKSVLFYVVDENYDPVKGYEEKMIDNM